LSDHFEHLPDLLGDSVGSFFEHFKNGLKVLIFFSFFGLACKHIAVLNVGNLPSDIFSEIKNFHVDIFELNLFKVFDIAVQKAIEDFSALLLL
jgi:hypothetical protein